MKSDCVPIGGPAPDFAFVDRSGKKRSIAGLAEQPVVVLFYRGHWCSSCRRQLSRLGAAYPALRALGAELVAISTDTERATRAATVTAGWPFPLVADVELQIIDLYGVRDPDDPEGRQIARPSVFVLDQQGTVRFCHVGSDRQDRPAAGAILLAVESLATELVTVAR